MNKVKIKFLFVSLMLFGACYAPKQAYQAKEENILQEMYENETQARRKMALEYLLQAQQNLKVEKYKQAELILLKALETNEYGDFVSYYLAYTFYHVKRYDEAMPYINNIETAFKKHPRYQYLVQKLKGDTLFLLNQRQGALNAYKKCLNMHSEDEYVKERVRILSDS